MREKTTLINTCVFDGHRILAPSTLIDDGGLIVGGDATAGVSVVNCKGHVLLPDLIDCHTHLDSKEKLAQMHNAGVTIAFRYGNLQGGLSSHSQWRSF